MVMPTDGIKISQLSSASNSLPTDEFPLNQSGVTKKTNPALISTDYKSLAVLPNSVIYLGNRSYQIVFPAVNYSGILSAAMRLRTTRTAPAQTQSLVLNGSNQYMRNTSPQKMGWTDDFASGGWVKLNNYPGSTVGIDSRYNGTSGFVLRVEPSGQVRLSGFNASASNESLVQTFQSLPLGKWVHITAQLDMSAFTASPTTSYVMFDGVDISCSVTRTGTNPTSLIQAGNLEIGSFNNGAGLFPGKIAQAFVSPKITQTNVKEIYSQGLTPALITSLGIYSAWSFDNNANDLNTTTPNNLTAMNAAGYTGDAPFGTQANGSISSTLDYAIIQSVSYSTDTTLIVQVPEGCTIPTSGGLSAVSYSTAKAPYGFPSQEDKWRLQTVWNYIGPNTTIGAYGTWVDMIHKIIVPIGSWELSYSGTFQISGAGAGTISGFYTLSSGAPTNGYYLYPLIGRMYLPGSVSTFLTTLTKSISATITSQSTYTIWGTMNSSNGTATMNLRGDEGSVLITARNAYL